MYRFKKALNIFFAFVLAVFMLTPQLAFANANQQALHYVALGDSLAEGVMSDNTIDKGYPEYIKADIEARTTFEVNLVNKGEGGFRTDQVLEQLNNDLSVQAEIMAADIVTISAGANDILQATNITKVDFSDPAQVEQVERVAAETINKVAENTAIIVGTIKQLNPKASVYVMGYYNALPYMDENVQPLILQLMEGLNLGIQGGAKRFGATFVPTYHVFHGKYDDYLPDLTNIHPNAAGYQALGNQFTTYIFSSWLFGNGQPESQLGGFYVDIDTLNVYQIINHQWQLIGNYETGSGNIAELDLSYGNGIPGEDDGDTGHLYLDVKNKHLYIKNTDGWLGPLDAITKEPIQDPVVPGQIQVDNEKINAVEKNGELLITIDNNESLNKILLSAEQVKSLVEKNATLKIVGEKVNLLIPITVVGDTTQSAVISIEKLDHFDGSLSNIYNFTITVDDVAVHHFEENITLAFQVDKELVSNPDNVKVYFYNEQTKEWELVGGEYNEGIVIANTNHFSQFSVFEKEENVKEEKPDPTENENKDGSPNEDKGKDDGNPKDKDKIPGAKVDNNKNKVKPVDKGTEGKKLPKTATETYNILLAGALFLTVGGALYLFTLRRKIV